MFSHMHQKKYSVRFHPICSTEELESVNVSIAKAALDGRLDANPFVQGILLKCLSKIEKQDRGVATDRGRQASCSETERRLVEGAAFTLALAGGNRELAVELGQNITPPRMHCDLLPPMGLPNPALSLRSCATEQLRQNLQLLDQRFARASNMKTRRLVLALDHTYLDKTMNQGSVEGVRGLLGGIWRPRNEGSEFIPFTEMSKDAARTPKANLMLEALAWDPCAVHQQCYSISAMPMSLAAPRDETVNKDHGKLDSGLQHFIDSLSIE